MELVRRYCEKFDQKIKSLKIETNKNKIILKNFTIISSHHIPRNNHQFFIKSVTKNRTEMSLTQEAVLTGSGDASFASTSLPLPEKERNLEQTKRLHVSSSKKFKTTGSIDGVDEKMKINLETEITRLEEEIFETSALEKIKEVHVLPMRRSVTQIDMATPRKENVGGKKEETENIEEQVDKLNYMKKKILMVKILSSLYYKLWKKKKLQNTELLEQVNQLIIQRSFLNTMREKESNKRDDLSKISEKQKRDIIDLKSQLISLTQERNELSKSLQTLEDKFSELQLELEKTEYLRSNLQKDNLELLDHMQKASEEIAILRSENKEQQQKIVYMNNVTNQQDKNMKQLHKIAEDLELNLKQKSTALSNAQRRRDEAIEIEQQAKYNTESIEEQLKESKILEKKLRQEMSHLKEVSSESEKRKIKVTLENVDLKFKLEEIETKLKIAQIDIIQLEKNIYEREQTFWIQFRQKFQKVPWNVILFHFGIFFFPAISRNYQRNY